MWQDRLDGILKISIEQQNIAQIIYFDDVIEKCKTLKPFNRIMK